MAGEGNGGDFEKATESDCSNSFVWDDDSKLYFHASSGFYHDPDAGWYYSSRDSLYYTFENGSYVLLTSKEQSEGHQCTNTLSIEPIKEKLGIEEHVCNDGTENQCRPSDWLEETLIDLYLSGYSNSAVTTDSSSTSQTTEEKRSHLPSDGLPDPLTSAKLPGCEDVQEAQESSDRLLCEDVLCDEEKWQAQYGQVVQSGDENLPSLPIFDIWDWKMVAETVKRNKVARLVGRLVRRSCKLHPSVPSGGGLLKTAAICDVHLDLVRVASGKIYRLRSPDIIYLASLSAYDSSNPTKDWGFPDLYINLHTSTSSNSNQTCGFNNTVAVTSEKSSAALVEFPPTYDKHNNYRDRAAERRKLHGKFSIAPGQRQVLDSDFYEEGSSSPSSEAEEAALEAMNLAFGQGSYARKILENMGWKDGEALGRTVKGILEPIKAVANKGNAGLGYIDIHRAT